MTVFGHAVGRARVRTRGRLVGSEDGAAPCAGQERGAAVVDFVLVGAVLTLLAMSIVQLAVILHVRNTLIDAASSGAHYGTLADRSATDGEERARSLVVAALGEDYAQSVTAVEERSGGRRTLRIDITAPIPVLGLIGPSGVLQVQGHGSVAS